MKPSKDGVCDACGSDLIVRNDDNEETFKERYNTYMETTMPLIKYYEEQGKLIKVDGINDTFEKIVSVVK